MRLELLTRCVVDRVVPVAGPRSTVSAQARLGGGSDQLTWDGSRTDELSRRDVGVDRRRRHHPERGRSPRPTGVVAGESSPRATSRLRRQARSPCLPSSERCPPDRGRTAGAEDGDARRRRSSDGAPPTLSVAALVVASFAPRPRRARSHELRTTLPRSRTRKVGVIPLMFGYFGAVVCRVRRRLGRRRTSQDRLIAPLTASSTSGVTSEIPCASARLCRTETGCEQFLLVESATNVAAGRGHLVRGAEGRLSPPTGDIPDPRCRCSGAHSDGQLAAWFVEQRADPGVGEPVLVAD